MARAPWERRSPPVSRLAPLVARWRLDNTLSLDRLLPASAGTDVALPEALLPPVRAALEATGIRSLYAHQREAFERATRGESLVVATPTASGKSLCFHLPVLQRLAARPNSRALYLLPTRALARDQARALSTLLDASGLPGKVVVYDGDTSPTDRRRARDEAAVIVTNPDMLHTGLLPHHTSWERLFSGLGHLVVDELHAYTGVFGAHLANVLARTERVARFYGAAPVALTASATIANPAEHASRLLGRPVTALTTSGAPTGARTLLVVDPSRTHPKGTRVAPLKATLRVALDLVKAGVSTLVFAASRGAVETLTRYLREAVVAYGLPEQSVHAYRGGYLADTRRRIEDDLRDGKIRCVVATNALELGVDIGALDAVVCAAWPGSLAALWQRFGRAGRRGSDALLVLVPGEDPVDRYVARDPAYLVRAPVEEARVDPTNLEVMIQHLQCAAFELPFVRGEGFASVSPEATDDALTFLAEQGVVHAGKDRWHWIGPHYPAATASLRTAGWERFLVVDQSDRATLGELDQRSAFLYAHTGAVYQHEGVAWWVEALDLEAHEARVIRSPHDWMTEPVTSTTVAVVETQSEGPAGCLGDTAAGVGEVSITLLVTGFRRVRFHTHEPLGREPLDLPELTHTSTGMWLTLPSERVDALVKAFTDAEIVAPRAHLHDGLRGVAHCLRTVASLALMCSTRDLSTALGLPNEAADRNVYDTVYLYDTASGGAGLAARVFERRDELIANALDLARGCPCDDGCPACVGIAFDEGAQGRKALTIRFLRWLSGEDDFTPLER